MNNNKGFTIIEILVALLIGCITAMCIASYISFLAGLNNRMKLRRASGEAIHAMAESIRFNLSLFQVTYDNSKAKEEEMLAPAALPLAVASNTIVPRSTCGTGTPIVRCTAYVGYIIVPSEIIRNLYQVKFLAVSTDKEATWKTDFTYFITVK